MRIWERGLWIAATIILLIGVVGLGILAKQTNERVNALEHQLYLSQHLAPGETISDVIIYLDDELSDLEQEVTHLITAIANLERELYGD